MYISFLKKKKWQLICGNGIAEIEGKKIYCNGFVAMTLPKQYKKKICDNGIIEIGDKKIVTIGL